jgi:hypothetical protein
VKWKTKKKLRYNQVCKMKKIVSRVKYDLEL